jgi:hypothetical protein
MIPQRYISCAQTAFTFAGTIFADIPRLMEHP